MINIALNMPRARISKVDLLFCVLKSWEWFLSFGQLSNKTTLSNAGSQALMVLANLWHQRWKAKDVIPVTQNGTGCCFALAFLVVNV